MSYPRRFVLFALVFLSAIPVFAQKGTLTGYVSDRQNGDPLPGAYVVIEALQKGTTTNGDGFYSYKLNPGSYAVRFRFIGYLDTLINVTIREDGETPLDVMLTSQTIVGEEVVVDAGRLGNKVRALARLRDEQKRGLQNWHADVYKLSILSSAKQKEGNSDTLDGKPVAFAERMSRVEYVAPARYTEFIRGRRASKNFFSEYDFFSTGGAPLDLNQNKVLLSVLSEDMTVVGPVSVNARKFYDFEEVEADSTWPQGTIELRIKPKTDNLPLFIGSVWLAADETTILGIDVRLNEYSETANGIFRVSNLRYQQSFKMVKEFWLPDRTEMNANIKILGSDKEIFYKDVWTWSNHDVNSTNVTFAPVSLANEVLNEEADYRPEDYWKSLSSVRAENPNAEAFQEAQEYKEKRVSVRVGMAVMRNFFRLPYKLESFYFTNLNDFYRFNRVEGHFLGLGLRSPLHKYHEYRLTGGYATAEDRFRYRIFGWQRFYQFPLVPEFDAYRQINMQFLDYEYNPTPIDFTETRATIMSLFLGIHNRNFFEREGITTGIRFRMGIESFLRVLYVNEQHRRLFENTDFNILGVRPDSNAFRNNIPGFETANGNMKGLYVHFHHDTRSYRRYQFLRDYEVGKFGWLSDIWYEYGNANWGSDFNYHRYRAAFFFMKPAFSSHFMSAQIVIGASTADTPSQRLFTYNGTVYDDYYRERPFLTVPFSEPIGNRVSLIRLRYKFGSSLTRKVPIDAIRKSGIRMSTFATAGWVDNSTSLKPLIPSSGATPQVEIGVAVAKIFSAFYLEVSHRVVGDYGNRIGLIFLF